jgi:hypothetical protein
MGFSEIQPILPKFKFMQQEVFHLGLFHQQATNKTIEKNKMTIGPLDIRVEPTVQPLYQLGQPTGERRETY